MDWNAERARIESEDRRSQWSEWGPYVSDRQWGTVREDYSANGDAWSYFPFDHARSRAYRWGEDGIFGISDRITSGSASRRPFGTAQDPILKERLLRRRRPRKAITARTLRNCYYHLDNVPSHAYMKALYKYPQRRISVPAASCDENAAANAQDGSRIRTRRYRHLRRRRVFRYRTVEYAKRSARDDILIPHYGHQSR